MKIRTWTIAALVVGASCVAGALRAQMSPSGAAVSHEASGVVEPPSAGADETRMSRPPQGTDAEFVEKAALAGKSEVEASRLALQQSPSPDVRAFAARMIDDHGGANRKLRTEAARHGIPVTAAQVDDPDVDALRGRSGHDFDVAYLAVAGPDAHEKAIALYEYEAATGRIAGLRAFARMTLPTLRHHLTMSQQLAQKVGVP